jgi:hypothetical protein
MSYEGAVLERPNGDAKNKPAPATKPKPVAGSDGHAVGNTPPTHFTMTKPPSHFARTEREKFTGATRWRHVNTSSFNDLILFTDQNGRRFMLKKVYGASKKATKSGQGSEWLLEVFVESVCVRRSALYFHETPAPDEVIDAIALADKERFEEHAHAVAEFPGKDSIRGQFASSRSSVPPMSSGTTTVQSQNKLSSNACEAVVTESIKKPVFEELSFNRVKLKYQCLLLGRPIYLDLEASLQTGHIVDKITGNRVGMKLELMKDDLFFTGDDPLISVVRREFRARTAWHKKFMAD